MAFTKEIVDLAGLSEDAIKTKLVELNIPLTTEEALKIQNDMLGRAPSLAELILFSIQGSEHCSYKSSRNHLKQFTTEGPDVVLGAKEDAGGDVHPHRYGPAGRRGQSGWRTGAGAEPAQAPARIR